MSNPTMRIRTANYYLQSERAKEMHDAQLRRFRELGYRVVEHSDTDAEVFYPSTLQSESQKVGAATKRLLEEVAKSLGLDRLVTALAKQLERFDK